MSFIDDLYTKAKATVALTAQKLISTADAAATAKVTGLYKSLEGGAVAKIENTIKSVPAIAKPASVTTGPGPNALAPTGAAGAAKLPAWAIPAALAMLLLGAYLLDRK